jgi:hypothetical protein
MEFGRRAKACYTNQVVAALFEELPPHPAKIFDSGRAPAQELQLKFALRPDSSVVERGPEKAGVGGSIPSLATTQKKDLSFEWFFQFQPTIEPARYCTILEANPSASR